MAKSEKVLIKMDPETKTRLQQLAQQSHTSMSEAVRQLIWSGTVKHTVPDGQMTIDEFIERGGRSERD